MSIKLSDAAANAVLETGYDAVFNSAVLELRSGTRPADANAAPTGSVLCSITLPADAFAAAASRTKAKQGTWSGTGAAAAGSGTNATWYRLHEAGDSGGVDATKKRQDGDITGAGGGGDMTLDNVNIAQNQAVTVNTFQVAL